MKYMEKTQAYHIYFMQEFYKYHYINIKLYEHYINIKFYAGILWGISYKEGLQILAHVKRLDCVTVLLGRTEK